MLNSILVICSGNICRSPTGERLLRQALPQLKVNSTGLCGMPGHPADSLACEIAAAHGVDLDDHVASRFTPEMARDYSLLLVMERSHLGQLTAMAPEIRGKTMLFGQWLDSKEIPDPYRKSYAAFEYVYCLLELASQEWAKRLQK